MLRVVFTIVPAYRQKPQSPRGQKKAKKLRRQTAKQPQMPNSQQLQKQTKAAKAKKLRSHSSRPNSKQTINIKINTPPKSFVVTVDASFQNQSWNTFWGKQHDKNPNKFPTCTVCAVVDRKTNGWYRCFCVFMAHRDCGSPGLCRSQSEAMPLQFAGLENKSAELDAMCHEGSSPSWPKETFALSKAEHLCLRAHLVQ